METSRLSFCLIQKSWTRFVFRDANWRLTVFFFFDLICRLSPMNSLAMTGISYLDTIYEMNVNSRFRNWRINF